MRRVYVVHYLRRLINPFTAKLAAFFMCAGLGALTVSVKNVMLNMPRVTEVKALTQFYMNAFWGTEFFVRALLAGMLVLLFLIAKDAATGLKRKKGFVLAR
ncbi:hypothetical protein HY250_02040 [Candidatus Azambacteria bacterium]|nr:hypothetical protein [Candidatus Azambacteria bacterium]MBI3685162.1 hypothetical protein [Candidatus Azambacteria bacterium]